MTGRTHKLGGKVAGSVAFVAINFNSLYSTLSNGINKESLSVLKAWNIKDTWQSILSAFAILMILRAFSKITSVLSDLDQQSNAIPYKDSLLALLLNKILLALGQHHRSRLTHTLLISLVVSAALIIGGLQFFTWDSPLMLVVMRYVCGIMSHKIEDMFNGTGIYLLPFSKKTVAFVPKKVHSGRLVIISLILAAAGVGCMFVPNIPVHILGVILIIIACSLLGMAICCRGMTFTTGGDWENIFYKVVDVLDIVVTTIAILVCFI